MGNKNKNKGKRFNHNNTHKGRNQNHGKGWNRVVEEAFPAYDDGHRLDRQNESTKTMAHRSNADNGAIPKGSGHGVRSYENQRQVNEYCQKQAKVSSTPSGSRSGNAKAEGGPKLDRNHFGDKERNNKGDREKAPHKSKCLECNVMPTSYCTKCLQWVCDDCARTDHYYSGCNLTSKAEAINQMKKDSVQKACLRRDTMERLLTELGAYDMQLDAFRLTMQTAFECTRKEKGRVDAMLHNGQARKRSINEALQSLENSVNFPESQSGLQELEQFVNEGKRWASSSNILDLKTFSHTTKHILLSSAHMMKMANSEDKTPGMILVSQTVHDKTLLSRMNVEGGRILVYSLAEMDTVPQGTIALPFTSIKSCIDKASALGFLEISCRGKFLGRVLIRMLGDTLRGRQFLMMCTGEAGPSFCNTHFHRVWSKSRPGESIWGGDYEKGDGSGGSTVLKVSNNEKSVPASKHMAVKAGLVSGSYENENPRTIFRVYTKDDVKPQRKSHSSYNSMYNAHSFSKEENIAKDTSAFGMVENGLDVFETALICDNITEVVIHACGVVIEAQ
ncbi:hypothetical protein SK128_025735 [Halocaridina rubra]|uniref:PPIase cyclophilin-type domain-containing protein n=1 Tax=Halocaridina rubra TaxID=373956 RepID=A0AAN8XAI2_HALRR